METNSQALWAKMLEYDSELSVQLSGTEATNQACTRLHNKILLELAYELNKNLKMKLGTNLVTLLILKALY